MMNGGDSTRNGIRQNGYSEDEHSNYSPSPTARYGCGSPTEFRSITTIEPMEDYPTEPDPLELIFEEHEDRSSNRTIAIARQRIKQGVKKPRFVSPPKILEVSEPDVPKAVAEEITNSLNGDDEDLAMQMEQISVSTHSEDSEGSMINQSNGDPPAARLEQISVRIFATILPDNETPEQRHCDLLQASGRLNELTNGAPVLVINCGEANTQLMTTFDRIQNCPFNLDGFPDLATFIAFCERVYDWLIRDSSHVVLLHAEGESARTRLLLLCQALACYYESGERRDQITSQTLRQYVTSYPNGITRTPVGWLRYTGYMRLFSPENCLFILRSSICIFHLALYNFPVFEENKLRLFFKFYSGCPLRLVYTTHIHTFCNPTSNGIMLSFTTPPDSKTPGNPGLYLVGDIALIAYHCRPYPARRLRLFRLHFHSCQGVTDSLTFQHEDFDDICDAFPSSVRFQVYCIQRTVSKPRGLDVREETMSPNSGIGRAQPVNLLGTPMTADDAVRSQDSLENLTATTSDQLSKFRSRAVSFRSYVESSNHRGIIRAPLLQSQGPPAVARHLRFASQSDSELILPALHETDAYDFSPEPPATEKEDAFQSTRRDSDDNNSLHKRILRALFRAPSTNNHRFQAKEDMDVVSASEIDTRQLMPPPSEPVVVRSTKHRRTVGKKLKEVFSAVRKDGSPTNGMVCPQSTGTYTPSIEYSSSDSNSSSSSSSVANRRNPPPRPPPPRLPPLYTSNMKAVKTSASVRGTATAQLGPPQKTRKVVTVTGSNEHVIASVPVLQHTEDLLEAARRLNFMAGTQELDRLLEELRLTSMNMASGLPPIGSSPSSTAYYSPKPYSLSGYPSRTSSAHQSGYHQQQQHTESRFHTTRSTSALGSYGAHDPGAFPYSSTSINHAPSGSYNYMKQSSYHTERRMDNLGRTSSGPYTSYRAPYSPVPTQRHQANYTTILKQRPPMGPRQLSQIHLTIDPECGTTETMQGHAPLMNGQGPSRREQLLESELNSARQELAQLRRAISLVDERRSARHEEVNSTTGSTLLSPARLPPPRSPAVSHQQFSSSSTSSFQGQQHGTRSSSTFQRSYPRQDNTYGSSFPLQKRAMSQTNVYGPRSWNLRSQQGSESNLAFRRVTSVTGSPGRSTYSAHRERLRHEREQELLLRQQQQQQQQQLQSQRQRQMAASTTGLHEQHTLQQQARHQQQYRSLSAVNQSAGTEAFEEVETIILQPIGRGVQDIDSHVGSLTTLARAPGGSLMDGLHRVDDGQRPGLARRGYSSTQYLHRNTSSSDIVKPTAMHQQQSGLGSQQLGPSRFGTASTLVNNGGTNQQLSGSRSQLSTTGSTIIAPATSVPGPVSNGWKSEPTKRAFPDSVDANNLSIVQETAPTWYRPTLSREAAISILRQQPPGSFLIRDSTTFKDAFGLAVKVATLPPKVTPKSDDLQSELVRHYLIEVVNAPTTKGVRLKGFASEPVFPSLAALIHQHTIDPLALPCRLILPPIPTNLPSAGSATLPPIVIGSSAGQPTGMQTLADFAVDNVTVTSCGSVLGAAPSDTGSTHVDGLHNTIGTPGTPGMRSDGGAFRCLMLGSIDTPQWTTEMCFARAVDQLIPLTLLTAAECDRGMSRVRYTEVQLHVSSHDGITIIDLQRRLFLRRHLPNHVLMYCGIEPRKKEFLHPEQKLHGIVHPKIFGIVVRKGISECTTHVFTECDPLYTADSIVEHIRATYPHMNVR